MGIARARHTSQLKDLQPDQDPERDHPSASVQDDTPCALLASRRQALSSGCAVRHPVIMCGAAEALRSPPRTV